ncbi:MAG: hypothetical protein JSU03_07365 [Bacteroidetes bacterium]|nr:hypothetical protein [Bacteroidota bacterium]
MKSEKMKSVLLKISMMLVGLVMSVAVFAQGDDPCNPGGDPGGGPDNCPIDSWVYVLIAAVVILAAVKAYKAKKLKAVSN